MDKVKKPLGIYVHIPFCVRKCNYCDFLSMRSDRETQTRYAAALCEEIKNAEEKFVCTDIGYKVRSIYIGGGTPSILDSDILTSLADCIYDKFGIADTDNIEFTIEANPGTVTLDKLKAFRAMGMNRLSMGLQSANDEELAALGRIHTYNDFVTAFREARKAGFENINVDIMTAIPHQTRGSLEHTLEAVMGMDPEHISAYSLILEEGTALYEEFLRSCPHTDTDDTVFGFFGEEDERAFYHFTVDFLSKMGYERYEISNFAKKGYESRHNTAYWMGVDYFGFGLGASSLIGGVRYKNTSDMEKYISAPTSDRLFEEQIRLELEDEMEEFMFLGLRMSNGISFREFMDRFGISAEERYSAVLDRLVSQKLLMRRDGRLTLTESGIDHGNYVFAQFLRN